MSPLLQTLAPTPETREPLLDMMVDFNRLEGIAWSREAGGAALSTLLDAPSLGEVGLLVEGDAVRGYFVLTWGYDLEWAGRDAFLTELYLQPEARGRGLGHAAMALVEAQARAAGARALHLMVRPENEPALRLYRAAGFEQPPRVFLTKALPTEG